MIRYALVCSQDHEFDGWFRSAADFDRQVADGLVSCAVCGRTDVQRALMAPSVLKGRPRGIADQVDTALAAPVPATVAAPSEPGPVAVMADPQQKAMLDALVELKRRITASADYVGDKFAEEARKIHYGEAPERGIYGQTTGEEARALIEEGIEVHPLPILPDERN